MNVLDLFSGIGGFSLGLERAGMKTLAFCEIEEFPRKVLAKHWPGVKIHENIKELDGTQYRGSVDVVCGGFPCQDISNAGKQKGLEGERSGLWSELARIVSEVRPKYAILENVSVLLHRGMPDVLRDLAKIGYDAEWHCIPASHLGAPHRRDRIWIIAYSNKNQLRDKQEPREECKASTKPPIFSKERIAADFDSKRELQPQGRFQELWRWFSDCSWWSVEPGVERVVYGVPGGVDRLGALGNAVVPQIPEAIGKAIMEFEKEVK